MKLYKVGEIRKVRYHRFLKQFKVDEINKVRYHRFLKSYKIDETRNVSVQDIGGMVARNTENVMDDIEL